MPRIYSVESEEELTLVKANSPSQALSHVAKNQYKVKPASAMDVAEYMEAGGEIEDANGDKADSDQDVPQDPPIGEEND